MARITENSKGRLRVEFESVNEVFRTIEEMGWTPKRDEASDKRGRSGFNHFESLAEAVDVYRNHPERVRQFNESDIKLESIESPGKDIYYDVTGDGIDIGRFMDGEPEVAYNATMGNPRSIFATINIHVSWVSYTEPRYIERLQRRVLRLVDWLESQNIRCQIVATSVTECAYFSCVVKQFTDPVDLNDIAVVCHTDFLRRIIFLIDEQSKTWSYGYGSGISYDRRMIKYSPEPEDGLYIYVGGYIPHSKLKTLEDEFDRIEASVKTMIEDGVTWNDAPLAIRGES